jgi:hypothetical protein
MASICAGLMGRNYGTHLSVWRLDVSTTRDSLQAA